MHPSGSAPVRIYGTPKMHEFPSTDTFLNFVRFFYL